MIAQATIDQAVELLKREAPDATVILFGSYARGDARDDSDLDLLVVKAIVQARRHEMVHLKEALRPLKVSVDVVVVSRKTFDEWADTPGTLIYHAAREGKVLYAAA